MEQNIYLIRHKEDRDDETGEPLFWSNEDGWVSIESATIFREGDSQRLNMCLGGEWVCLSINPNKIIIVVDGGLVQSVNGLPPGTEYEIHDYDVEGCDHKVDPIEEDENGKEFYRIQSVVQ